MNATRMFWPSARSPLSVDELSAIGWPISTRSPLLTIGRWLMHVPWLDRTNFVRGYSMICPVSSPRTFISWPVDSMTSPGSSASTTCPESRATRASIPVPTTGACGLSSGTAWRCMFDPIRARLASSCSRNGISAVDTETICIGDTSMYWTLAGFSRANDSPIRISACSPMICIFESNSVFACPMMYVSSSSADR